MLQAILVLLTLAGIILKVAGLTFVAGLSWWLIFLPLLLLAALTVFGLGLAALVAGWARRNM